MESDNDKVLVFQGEQRPVAVPEEIVLLAQRPYRAYTAHQKGVSWLEIAEIEGYPTATAAQADVRRYLSEGQALVSDFTRSELLTMAVEQLRKLRSCVWEDAMDGKLPAVKLARDLIIDEVQLLRLNETTAEEATGGRTVVVSGGNDHYITTLERVAED